MNLIIRASGAHNIVIRPQGRPAFYADATARPAAVEVYWRYEDESPLAARLIGTFLPGQKVDWPYTPVGDKNVYLGTISISAAGTRSVRSLRDAVWTLVTFQRETVAPTVTQVGEATHTLITLSIGNFSQQFATKRKVRTADDEAMTTNVSEDTVEVDPGQQLSRVVYLTRPDPGAGARTIWVRVSHSSGGEFGAESAAEAFTWANSVGGGGTTGGGTESGGDEVPCFSGNVRIQVPGGYKSFTELRELTQPFRIVNLTGVHPATLIVHHHTGPMIDMGKGELVTLEHAMKHGDGWRRADQHFPDRPRVQFDGEVFNLHILSHDPADQHYVLKSGDVAHNAKIDG